MGPGRCGSILWTGLHIQTPFRISPASPISLNLDKSPTRIGNNSIVTCPTIGSRSRWWRTESQVLWQLDLQQTDLGGWSMSPWAPCGPSSKKARECWPMVGKRAVRGSGLQMWALWGKQQKMKEYVVVWGLPGDHLPSENSANGHKNWWGVWERMMKVGWTHPLFRLSIEKNCFKNFNLEKLLRGQVCKW